MAIFHIAYLSPAGRLLQESAQDLESLRASPPAARIMEVLTAKLAKNVGMHAIVLDEPGSPPVTLQWSLMVETTATVQLFAGDRAICTAILLDGTNPEAERAALLSAQDALEKAVREHSRQTEDDLLRVRERPACVAFLWDSFTGEAERMTVSLVLACFAGAFFGLRQVV